VLKAATAVPVDPGFEFTVEGTVPELAPKNKIISLHILNLSLRDLTQGGRCQKLSSIKVVIKNSRA
jgi:hypothetical protein